MIVRTAEYSTTTKTLGTGMAQAQEYILLAQEKGERPTRVSIECRERTSRISQETETICFVSVHTSHTET
mgnify:CR=1 FL=1